MDTCSTFSEQDEQDEEMKHENSKENLEEVKDLSIDEDKKIVEEEKVDTRQRWRNQGQGVHYLNELVTN